MISYSFIVTISHSDGSFTYLFGYLLLLIHCFRSLYIDKYFIVDVQIDIQYKWSNPIRFVFQVADSTETDSSCPESRELPIPFNRNLFAQPKPIRPRSQVAPHRDPDRDHGPDVPRLNVCIQMYESESGK
jgi:hypothetical protein